MLLCQFHEMTAGAANWCFKINAAFDALLNANGEDIHFVDSLDHWRNTFVDRGTLLLDIYLDTEGGHHQRSISRLGVIVFSQREARVSRFTMP